MLLLGNNNYNLQIFIKNTNIIFIFFLLVIVFFFIKYIKFLHFFSSLLLIMSYFKKIFGEIRNISFNFIFKLNL